MVNVQRLLLAAIAVSWSMAFVPARGEKTEQIRLGGVRNVTTEIERRDDVYQIRVRFRRVQVFSEGTNDRLNLAKGRNYALRSLARHLVGKKSTHLSVSGVTITDVKRQDEYVAFTFLVPASSVQFSPITPLEGDSATRTEKLPRTDEENKSAEALKLPGKEKGGQKQELAVKKPDDPGKREELVVRNARSELLARKSDYLNTIATLSITLADDLAKLVTSSKDEESFVEELSRLEEQASTNFITLKKSISTDLLLLSDEKDELLQKIEIQVVNVLEAIAEADETYKPPKSAPVKKSKSPPNKNKNKNRNKNKKENS